MGKKERPHPNFMAIAVPGAYFSAQKTHVSYTNTHTRALLLRVFFSFLSVTVCFYISYKPFFYVFYTAFCVLNPLEPLFKRI